VRMAPSRKHPVCRLFLNRPSLLRLECALLSEFVNDPANALLSFLVADQVVTRLVHSPRPVNAFFHADESNSWLHLASFMGFV